MLPLIGISTYREQARWGVWDQPADLLPATYAVAVETAGGVPVLLPPSGLGDPRELAESAVARLDGLVISGGSDVSPARYGAEPGPHTVRWRDDRDAWELALLDAAQGRGLPVLGICRGMQLLAVAAGGVLEQHLPDRVRHDRHNPGGDAFGEVEVSTVSGSRLGALVGDRQHVGCHHHQAVLDHPGFEPAAWSEDGTLEAMERPGDRFVVAVQWHPETRADAGLFRGLVAAAASASGTSGRVTD